VWPIVSSTISCEPGIIECSSSPFSSGVSASETFPITSTLPATGAVGRGSGPVMVGRSARDDGRVDRLTPRQLQVLGLLAEGRSNLAIAHRLAITEKAVARHAAQIYDALGLPPNLDDHRRVLAVVRFLDR